MPIESTSPEDLEAQRKELDAAIETLKKKYPSTIMFTVRIPYNGTFIVRQQTLNDVREVATILEKHEKSMYEKVAAIPGGKDDAAANLKRNEIITAMRNESSDISNMENLRRCVLYPLNFAASCDEGTIPGGIMASLIGYVMTVSGWSDDVLIEEV